MLAQERREAGKTEAYPVKRLLVLLFLLTQAIAADERLLSFSVLVAAEPGAGFCWPYYLYVPPQCAQPGQHLFPLLITPNNSGKIDDNPEVHQQAAAEDLANSRRLADILGCPVLVPTFPRPAAQWQLYTHALDLDTLLQGAGDLNRVDFQLLAMIQNCRLHLDARGIKLRPKIWMQGFSAAGMFANRFALLHPESVEAVAVGAPGGWPMAPVQKFSGKELPYPVGCSDLITLTGKPLEIQAAREIHFFFFQGDQDENDSVAYDDGYDAAERKLVQELFGLRPVDRWPHAQKLYAQAQLQAQFKLYPGVGHETNADMRKDLVQFFQTLPGQ